MDNKTTTICCLMARRNLVSTMTDRPLSGLCFFSSIYLSTVYFIDCHKKEAFTTVNKQYNWPPSNSHSHYFCSLILYGLWVVFRPAIEWIKSKLKALVDSVVDRYGHMLVPSPSFCVKSIVFTLWKKSIGKINVGITNNIMSISYGNRKKSISRIVFSFTYLVLLVQDSVLMAVMHA